MTITKALAKQLLGLSTDAELARLLGPTKQAVCRWGENDPLPEGRQWQLRALRPDLFVTGDDVAGQPAEARHAA